MRVPASQLRKGDIIEYSSRDFGLQAPYTALEGEILAISYTERGMRIKTATGAMECSRLKHFNRVTPTPILGRESWPTYPNNKKAEQFKGVSIE